MQLRKFAPTALSGLVALALVVTPMALDAAPPNRSSRKTRTLSFEDDVVETTYLRPESSVVETLNKKKRSSLIRIRMDFFAEIIRSARNL